MKNIGKGRSIKLEPGKLRYVNWSYIWSWTSSVDSMKTSQTFILSGLVNNEDKGELCEGAMSCNSGSIWILLNNLPLSSSSTVTVWFGKQILTIFLSKENSNAYGGKEAPNRGTIVSNMLNLRGCSHANCEMPRSFIVSLLDEFCTQKSIFVVKPTLQWGWQCAAIINRW